MWPTWLLQAFEFMIPAVESSRTVEVNTPIGGREEAGLQHQAQAPRQL